MIRIPAYLVGSILAFGSVLCLVRRIDWQADGEIRHARMWRWRPYRTARGTSWR